MATSTRHVCRNLRQISRLLPSQRHATPVAQIQQFRQISSTICRFADDPASTGKSPAYWAQKTSNPDSTPKRSRAEDDVLHDSEYLTPEKPYTANDLSPQERADYEVLTKPEQVEYLRLQNHVKALLESEQGGPELESLADDADREIEREDPSNIIDFPMTRTKPSEIGYWGEDEEDEFGQMEDADDDWSDEYITSVAESELDLHRDIREYTRIAAWDLPLLQQYAKPFQPPNHSTPLRFRYTTYMGETHPASRKVVVEVSTKDLMSHPSTTYKINEAQRTKLIKLAGVRYNPDTDILKMSSEKFETPAQNKRHLGDLIGQLIKEAKDKRDDLKDIPLDKRHVKTKTIFKFPEEWKLSSAGRIKQLVSQREAQKLLPPDAVPVDGVDAVKEYVRVGAGQLSSAKLLR